MDTKRQTRKWLTRNLFSDNIYSVLFDHGHAFLFFTSEIKKIIEFSMF